MPRSSALALPLAMLFALQPVAAECEPTTQQDAVPLSDGNGETLYVALWACPDNCVCNIVTNPLSPLTCGIEFWVYREVNGWGGLQRRDERRDDTCGGAIDPDELIL